MSLRELTALKHRDAERTAFAQLLLSGNITSEQYGIYLLNMLHIYHALEYHAHVAGLLKTLTGLDRSFNIAQDLAELVGDNRPLDKVTKTAHEYFAYLGELAQKEPNKLLAHVYVRHMGDLYGGQMIAKKVPGSGKFYEFEKPEELKASLRELLTDDLGEEANVAFDYAIGIMRDLMALINTEE